MSEKTPAYSLEFFMDSLFCKNVNAKALAESITFLYTA